MQSDAQECGCLRKDEGLCGLVRRCVCVFTSTGEPTRKMPALRDKSLSSVLQEHASAQLCRGQHF